MQKTEKEIVFDIWGLKLFLGHVRHVKARRRVMKDLRKRQMFVLDYWFWHRSLYQGSVS